MDCQFGDGRHDDTQEIQNRLDSGASLIYLPPPKAFYLISNTLMIHSGQELRLDPLTEIRLASKSNCPMLTNDDYERGNSRIAVTGGIWNGNNLEQAPNPQMVTLDGVTSGDGVRRLAMPADWPLDPVTGRQEVMADVPWHPKRYWGELMRFVNVNGFAMSGVTFKDPVTYACQSAKLTDFTFKDIVFDFNEGNPSPNNMDGLHFDGGCRFGKITNLHGACYDDLLAFNAEDGLCDSPFMGPISDIDVDGVFAERCHSCARFLSNGSPIENISIRNVHGSFYRYAFGFTHYFPERPLRGVFDFLYFENLAISKALPLPGDWNRCPDWGLFWAEGNGDIGTICVSGFKRVETTTPVPSFEIEGNFTIGQLVIEGSVMENHLSVPIEFIHNEGKIGRLVLRDTILRQDKGGTIAELSNQGEIGQLVRQ